MTEIHLSWGDRDVFMALPTLEDHIAKTITNTQTFYEIDLLESLLSVLTPGDLVVDVGANVGNHTVFFAVIAGCMVVSYEPAEVALSYLRRNVELNGLKGSVDIRPVAVGRNSGRAKIVSCSKTNLGATSVAESADGGLPLVSLDEERFSKKVTLLKIDVEGMEADVLAGAAALIQNDRPLIVCELWDHKAFAHVCAMLRADRYVPLAIFNSTDTYLFVPESGPSDTHLLVTRASKLQVLRAQRLVRGLAMTSQQKYQSLVETHKSLVETHKWLVENIDLTGLKLNQIALRAKQTKARLAELERQSLAQLSDIKQLRADLNRVTKRQRRMGARQRRTTLVLKGAAFIFLAHFQNFLRKLTNMLVRKASVSTAVNSRHRGPKRMPPN